MGKRAGMCLLFRIHAVADGAALHEDDRMMAVLAYHCGGKSEDETRFRSTSDQFETLR
jgi:hypothetical protein